MSATNAYSAPVVNCSYHNPWQTKACQPNMLLLQRVTPGLPILSFCLSMNTWCLCDFSNVPRDSASIAPLSDPCSYLSWPSTVWASQYLYSCIWLTAYRLAIFGNTYDTSLTSLIASSSAGTTNLTDWISCERESPRLHSAPVRPVRFPRSHYIHLIRLVM